MNVGQGLGQILLDGVNPLLVPHFHGNQRFPLREDLAQDHNLLDDRVVAVIIDITSFQVIREPRPPRGARVHRDEGADAKVEQDLFFEIEARQVYAQCEAGARLRKPQERNRHLEGGNVLAAADQKTQKNASPFARLLRVSAFPSPQVRGRPPGEGGAAGDQQNDQRLLAAEVFVA
jgi:hypothetical protein